MKIEAATHEVDGSYEKQENSGQVNRSLFRREKVKTKLKDTMKKHVIRYTVSALLLMALAWPGAKAVTIPLVEYAFNDAGTTTASTGFDKKALNLLKNSVATDLHSLDALGVSGFAGDVALDLTGATGMGSLGGAGNGVARLSSPSFLSNLTSFTLQGWFKPDGTIIGSNAYLLQTQNGTAQIKLNAEYNGKLSLTVDNIAAATASVASYSTTSSWTFFAVTYDGTVAADNVTFYVGGVSTSVSQVGTVKSINAGAVNPFGAGNFSVGNSNGTDRPFDGLMDNFRIFGTTSGSSGVLSLSDLEALRMADLEPNPATVIIVR